MRRFNNVTYSASTGIATIGAGLIWDDVYAALEQYNVNVVGARATGVGVAGFILGGGAYSNCPIFPAVSLIIDIGYSFLTNQYGLAVDTVQAFELVLPNGTVTLVT